MLSHVFIGTLFYLVTVCCANSLADSCVDSNWTNFCKISVGDTYTGRKYIRSISGKPCIGGTVCEYDYNAISIQCQISSAVAPYFEECDIPLCSDLPLCDSQLDDFHGVMVDSREGVALVSTAGELMAAARNHTVTEVELLRDITISETDFKGVPLFFRQGRNLVINKSGKARLIVLLSEGDSLPGFFVSSGANVTTYRGLFLGNVFVGPYIHWEKLGHYTMVDTEFFIEPCWRILNYATSMSALQVGVFNATVFGEPEDFSLEFRVYDSNVLPGGGGRLGTTLYDPEKNLGGTQRYINCVMRCNPNLYTPPPPTTTSPSDQRPSLPTSTEPPSPSNGSAQGGKKYSGYGLVVGVVVLVVVLVTCVAAFAVYRRRRQRHQPEGMDCDEENAICEPNDKTYSESIQNMAEQSEDKTVLSSAKLCEEIASVMTSVTQMTLQNRSIHMREAHDFCASAKSATFKGIPGHSSCPNNATPNSFDATLEGNSGSSKNTSGASSSAESAITKLQAGNVVDGYEYIRHLGSGTHADVLLVRKADTQLCYTMKVSKEPANLQVLIQEAYLLAMLDHPNILQHEETLVHNGELIIVTEYCSFGDLQQCLATVSGPFPEVFIRSVLFQLAFAVSHMHMHSVAHRDIKPSNIFVSEDGILKLGDLGSGRVIVDTSETFAGTPMFMAPQIIAGEAYTKECDIYSLGSVIYYLCCGKVAHSDAKSMDELKELQMKGPDVSFLRKEYSECLRDAVSRMMSPSEVLRPSANEIYRWKWLQQDVGEDESNLIDFPMVIRELLQSANIHDDDL